MPTKNIKASKRDDKQETKATRRTERDSTREFLSKQKHSSDMPSFVAFPTALYKLWQSEADAGSIPAHGPAVLAALACYAMANRGRIPKRAALLKNICGRIKVVQAVAHLLEDHPEDPRYYTIPGLIERQAEACKAYGEHLSGEKLTKDEAEIERVRYERNATKPNTAFDLEAKRKKPAEPQKTAKVAATYDTEQTSEGCSPLRSEQPSEVVRPAPRSRAPKGTPFPDGWTFGPRELAAVASRRETLTDLELKREFTSFEDYSRRKGSVWADWMAAWRNWVSKAEQFRAKDRDANVFKGVKSVIL